MTKNFLEIDNVTFTASAQNKVNNVSLSIENQGDIICLLGPSGIGKTTILRTIAGLVKINSGKIYELAEVVKDLNKNTDIIADQSYSERQLFEKAYERLKSEFEAVLNISPEEVQKKMDKALGRTNISESVE